MQLIRKTGIEIQAAGHALLGLREPRCPMSSQPFNLKVYGDYTTSIRLLFKLSFVKTLRG